MIRWLVYNGKSEHNMDDSMGTPMTLETSMIWILIENDVTTHFQTRPFCSFM